MTDQLCPTCKVQLVTVGVCLSCPSCGFEIAAPENEAALPRDMDTVRLRVDDFCFVQYRKGDGEWLQCKVMKVLYRSAIRHYQLRIVDRGARRGLTIERLGVFKYVRTTFMNHSVGDSLGRPARKRATA